LIGLRGADNIAVCAHAETDPHHEVGGGNHSASCARSPRSWRVSASASAWPALPFRLTGGAISRERQPPSGRRSTPDRRTPTTRRRESTKLACPAAGCGVSPRRPARASAKTIARSNLATRTRHRRGNATSWSPRASFHRPPFIRRARAEPAPRRGRRPRGAPLSLDASSPERGESR